MHISARATLLLAVTAAVPLLVGAAFAQPVDDGQGAVVTMPGQALPPLSAPMSSPARSGPPPGMEIGPLPGPALNPNPRSGAGPVAAAPSGAGPDPFVVEDAPPDLPVSGADAASGTGAGPEGWDEQVGATIVWDTAPLGAEAGGGTAVASGPARRIPQLSGDSDGGTVTSGGAASSAEQALIAREPRRERAIDPARRGELVALSRVLGQLHALRVSCSGRDDQTWRSRMATLLDLEAPASGALREPLVAAFNAGFQAGGRGTATCPPQQRTAEARLAREGRALALSLAARSRQPVMASASAAATENTGRSATGARAAAGGASGSAARDTPQSDR